VLEIRVRARVMVKVRARVRDSWGTKRLGTKILGYEMSGSRWRSTIVLHRRPPFR